MGSIHNIPRLRAIVLEPSVALNSPLHVASPDCATLYSMPPGGTTCSFTVPVAVTRGLRSKSKIEEERDTDFRLKEKRFVFGFFLPFCVYCALVGKLFRLDFKVTRNFPA